MPATKKVYQNFFKKWNYEMAYVLGFFAADGTMIKNKRGAHFIEFHITDLSLLKQIRYSLGSNHKISKTVKREKEHTSYRLQIGSKEIFSDLTVLGFTECKSKTIIFPEVPKQFFPDFVHGYFDGDGCVSFTKIYRKERGKNDWSFTTRFTSGSKKFLDELHRRLVITNELSGGYIYKKKRGYELVFSRRDSLALFHLMYNTGQCSISLERKRRVFIQAFKILGYAYMRL